jgi:hypothetical protein
MTAILCAPHQVGERVYVQRNGPHVPGRTTSVYRTERGVAYLIRTDPADGGQGDVVNIWGTCGHLSFIGASGSTR